MSSKDTDMISLVRNMILKPGATVRDLEAMHSSRIIAIIIPLAGFLSVLGQEQMKYSNGNMLWAVLITAILFGPASAFIGLFGFSFVHHRFGRMLGGKSTYKEIVTAIALSNLPSLFLLFLWIPALILFGGEMFTKLSGIQIITPLLFTQFIIKIFGMIATIYSVILITICSASVNGISIAKSILNIFASLLFVVIIVFLILYFIKLLV